MNILLIQPNINMKDTGVQINHGLSIIAAVLKEECHEVVLKIIDSASYNRKRYIEYLEGNAYDLIAFTTYSNQWGFIKKIASEYKKIGDKHIVCGGPHATLFPDALDETSAIDAFVVGEGEIALKHLIRRLSENKSLEEIPGIWYRDGNGKIIRNGIALRVENLDELPFSNYRIYDRKVVLNYPGIIFTRGCPYNCSYCCNHIYRKIYALKGSNMRFMSPRRAVLFAKTYKEAIQPDHLEIDDDTFTKNPKWLRKFLDEYKEEVKLPFNCNARPETITQEIVQWLKEAGCEIVSIGCESGNEDIREKLLKRRMKNVDIERAAAIIHKGGLKLSTFNMVGLPGESWERFFDTVRLNQKILPEYTQITVYYPFRGTELGDYCYSKGLVKEGAIAESYFGGSILMIPGFPKWQISLSHRLFKFLVFYKSNFFRAFIELLKDIVKALPLSYVLINPYMKIKKLFKTIFKSRIW